MVATILIQHIIPRFGLPQTLQSDNGPAFISSVTQQVAESLNITWKLHIPYHPQSLGSPTRTCPSVRQSTPPPALLSPAHFRLPL
ncbi:igE-binding protein-like isoform X2 [Lontra canadensis]|uniref:igE-binding protein-like isoform X2 n=1 Tax=Lontra canadensis TaxID=76717 RepID=UPI0013F30742|nr:igE-binding protein-like isoform X2 [Lontra canadensis]